MELLVFVAEIVGTVAFAISGALASIEKRLDLFGMMVVGTVTAVGGGITRDVIIGVTPPAAFTKPVYTLIAAATCLALFIFLKSAGHKINLKQETLEAIVNIIDAIGLAAFVVVGVDVSLSLGYTNAFFAIFTGTITGVGGGMLRDIFLGEIPLILYKRVYAVTAILGALMHYYLCMFDCPRYISIPLCFILIITIRFCAAKYRWKLPKIDP